MRKIIVLFLLALTISGYSQNEFLKDQKRYSRFREASETKSSELQSDLTELGIKTSDLNIYIEALKREQILNVYVRGGVGDYQLFRSFKFCYFIGTLGPKREQGDLQVPEGIYYIDRFNPYSTYYLSLGINYPNKSDRILGNKTKLGGDIFIHGDCVSLGCIPLTDDKIKELYVLSVWAKNSGQIRVPVYMFPSKLDDTSFSTLKKSGYFKKNQNFWNSLKKIYDSFHSTMGIPKVRVDEKGNYFITE